MTKIEKKSYYLVQFAISCSFGFLMLVGQEAFIKRFLPSNKPLVGKRLRKNKVRS